MRRNSNKCVVGFLHFELLNLFLIERYSSLLDSTESEKTSKNKKVLRGISFKISKYLLSLDNCATAVVPDNRLNCAPFLNEWIFSSRAMQKYSLNKLASL